MAETKPAPAKPKPGQPSPVEGPSKTFVKDGDLRILTVVGIVAMSVLIIFGAAVYWSGILDFPALAQNPAERDYVNDSLVYRERRMMLALVMRTFLTGFSFVVGLALCTMGGLFILRQVTSLTELSGNAGGAGVMGDAPAKEVADRLQKTQFSFSSYSPGVVFMVGGVTIMVVTQMLAIPVKAVEIVPTGAAALCLNEETGAFGSCDTQSTGGEEDSAATGDMIDPNAFAAAIGSETGTTFMGTDTGGGVQVVDASDVGLSENLGGIGFATGEAMIEDGSAFNDTEVSSDETYFTLDDLANLELPGGRTLEAVSPANVLIRTESGLELYGAYNLNFGEDGWGLPE